MFVAARWTGREAAALRQARRMSVRGYAASLGVSAAAVANWDSRGELARLNMETQQLLDIDLARAPDDVQQRFASVLGDRYPGDMDQGPHTRSTVADGDVASTSVGNGSDGAPDAIEVHVDPGVHDVELVRQNLIDALREGSMSEASLEDWDVMVLRHGRATRDRPANVVLEDLHTDLAELTLAIHRHRSASVLRRLTRVAARMSGLMTLTLCKLDHRSAFRRWARTARVAADEAGDPETQSWTLAQEAYGHFYSADLAEAIEVAQHAQTVAAQTPCVGTALAAALEARAYAVMGRDRDTRSALGRAESSLSDLNGEALVPSAFGYNEAQFRFHEGNAYTYLGDVRSALKAQERALELCAPSDYTDWAMTHLDRTSCLVKSGDISDALNAATEILASLSDAQRRGIITLRGHEILNSLPKDKRRSAAARSLREVLMVTTVQKEVPGLWSS
jgi:tetratricopeptide (TPR) repeat protein